MSKLKLGEILLEAGLLSGGQLQQAVSVHKQSGLKLGQYLVRNGIVAESDVVKVLADQLKLDVYRPSQHAVDPGLADLIPFEMADRHQVAPLESNDLLMWVALTDPLDIHSLDAVELHTRTEVVPVICTEQQLLQLHKSLYGSYTDIGGVLQNIGDLQIEDGHKQDNGSADVDLQILQGMAEKAPVVTLVNSIISNAVQEEASDVHISPQKDIIRLRFRVDGRLHEVPAPPKHWFLSIASRLKILAGMDIAVSRRAQDGRFNVKLKNRDINVRVSTIPSIYGENLVLRLLDTGNNIYSLERLGMDEEDRNKLESVIGRPHGMILSTGPTGSGKSTSLYAILKTVNEPDINIVTIEDPVEYRIDNIMQVQLNNRAGMSFADGLRSILRQDPDVVMVGEIRDLETAGVAVQAALTGHRVLSTLHTNDAAGAVTRMLDMGIEPFLVSSVMAVSFAQRLVRKVCPACKEPYTPTGEVIRQWNLESRINGSMARGKGCSNCMHTGYRGRTGIYEVLVADETVRDMILKRRSGHEIKKAAVEAGRLKTLKHHAVDKALKGITTLEEVAALMMD